MNHYTPKEAVILLVDYRRTMLGFVNTDHLLSYAVSGNQLQGMVKDVRNSMDGRLPGPDVTQEQLRNRSWWKGPELFVIVDDYDLVATQAGNPLQPLSEFLPQAKDVGLHMIVTRRTGGASRSTYDPVIGKLKEISSPAWSAAAARTKACCGARSSRAPNRRAEAPSSPASWGNSGCRWPGSSPSDARLRLAPRGG